MANNATQFVAGRHLVALDGVRGIAVLMVLLHHLQYVIPNPSAGWDIVKAVFYIGWTGVDLFFVLSGFLITSILLDTRSASNYFQSFYARRALRIFPLYYGVLGGILLIDVLAGSAWLHWMLPVSADRKLYFVFLQNWWLLLHGKPHANMIGHFWSLAVEEQFYLMWSVCVWLAPPRRLWKLCVAFFLGTLILRVGVVALAGPSQHLLENTFMRLDTLLAGAGCAILVRHRDVLARVERRLGLIAIGAFLAVELILIRGEELFHASTYTESVGFSLIAIGFSTLVLHSYLGRNPDSLGQKILCSGWLTRFGRYSYGIYVYHVPILLVAERLLRPALPVIFRSPWTALLYVAAVIGLSFLVAMISYELCEKRFLAYKHRFAPRYSDRERRQHAGAGFEACRQLPEEAAANS
jgi:peptidoglycan/LPS O-acetylase OafA/YrhL